MTALLEVSGLEASYGASQVLHGIDLRIAAGEAVTLLGRNGMGKTTTVRAILGLTPPSRGSVHLHGSPVQGLPPDRIARKGIGLVPEGRRIFSNLNVEENLVAFASTRNVGRSPWTLDRVWQLFPRLHERREHLGNQLSGGEQQMLAIGRALMTNPQLLVIDEATEGLAPLVREEIWSCLRRLRDDGQAILVIDKYVQRLIPLCDRHYLIESGRVVWSGTSRELEAQPALWQGHLAV